MVVMNKNIILMTKIPVHGFSKSRLARHLGNSNCKRLTLTNIESIKKNVPHFLLMICASCFYS